MADKSYSPTSTKPLVSPWIKNKAAIMGKLRESGMKIKVADPRSMDTARIRSMFIFDDNQPTKRHPKMNPIPEIINNQFIWYS